MVDISSLPTLRQSLEKYELRAKKSLGQNFLTDTHVVDRIVGLLGNVENINLIEIGPGPASLTRALIPTKAATITGVELDRRCIPLLEDLATYSDDRLSVIEADAPKLSLDEMAPRPRAIVSNLPYNIATPLLINWLNAIAEDPTTVTSMTLMFQKEVVQRIAAEPNCKAYGRLSVIAQWLCDVQYGFDVPPGAFTPSPKITSAVAHFIPLAKPRYPADKATLERVVATAFNQRRKMLRASLKPLGFPTEPLLESVGIDPTRRAETLSIEEFCRLSEAVRTQ